jgi:4-amino-4-deoxy-L-arabinose transferase-like glycosyltransferase
MKKQNLPFWLLTITVFIFLIIPVLIKDGMFMDGQLYACVAKNLANGSGTFWYPYFSATWFKAGSIYYLEHPQLVYGIQSLFFRVLGSSIYTERIYSLLTAIISAYLISIIWRLHFKNRQDLKKLSWLPVLLWIIIPICFWSYQNNMHENTMGIFTLLAVYFIIRAINNNMPFLYIILASICIFLASFSKGIPGFFPILTATFYWIIYRKISFRRMMFFSFLLIIVPILIYSIIILNNEARESLIYYLNNRLFYSIQGSLAISKRYHILQRLFMELIPDMIITVLCLLYFRIMGLRLDIIKDYKKHIIFYFLIGLSGSLPLLLTLVQKGYYLVPCLPFFAIGFSIIILPGLKEIIGRIDVNKKYFKYLLICSILLLSFSIIFSGSQIGEKGRDQDLLNDIYLIGKTIPEGEIIRIEKSIYDDWPLQVYLMRYFNISGDPTDLKHDYYLLSKDLNIVPEGYEKISLTTKKYDLYTLEKERLN